MESAYLVNIMVPRSMATLKSHSPFGEEAWVLNSSCSCCHDYCTMEAFKEVYNHGNCTFGNECCTSGQRPIKWTHFCAAGDMPFTVTCNYNYLASYNNIYCTCRGNINVVTTCEKYNGNSPIQLYYIALIAFLPLAIVLLYAIHKYKINRRKNKIKPSPGYTGDCRVPVATTFVKCNILVVVGDRDELKFVSEQLETAVKSLARTKETLKLTRISILHLYLNNYSVECDKAIFFLDLVANSTDNRLSHCKEKIAFTKGEHESVAIVYMDKGDTLPKDIVHHDPNFSFQTPRHVNDFDEFRAVNIETSAYEISIASNAREIWKWLPFVTRVIFGNGRSLDCIRNMFRQKYFSLRTLFKGDETTETLRQQLCDILTSCGANEASNTGRIYCNIYVVSTFREKRIWNEIKEIQNVYIFSAANVTPVFGRHQNVTAALYRKDDMITGIYKVLHTLGVVN